ncbi:MAG TPA: hypothetical protein VFN78_07195 [Ktedonobacterales bacterium]|nr:hypothetical protein [Ktedonobacterales bacterium]
MYPLFEQARFSGFSQRTSRENLIIALLLYFGSINLYPSLSGEVWFTAQIIGMTCTLVALLLGLRRRFAWSAALMGCAFVTRGAAAVRGVALAAPA